MKKVTAIILLILLLTSLVISCDSDEKEEEKPITDGSINPVGLVPGNATILAGLDIAAILDDDDVNRLYESLAAKSEDMPRTIEDALNELGVDLEEAILFGDLNQMPDISGLAESMDPEEMFQTTEDLGYFAIILKGDFDQEDLVSRVSEEEETVTSSYKGSTVYSDESGEISFSFLGEDGLVLGASQPVRDVIAVMTGDKSAIKGEILTAYNDLGEVMVRLAMVIPDDLLTEAFELDSEEMGLTALNPLFEDLEIITMSVDKRGALIPVSVRLCFSEEETAENVKGMLGFMLGMMNLEDMEIPEEEAEMGDLLMELLESLDVNLDGSCVDISLQITVPMIEEMIDSIMESMEDIDLGEWG